MKSEEKFFDTLKEEKRHSAAGLRSQRDSLYHASSSPRSSFYSTRLDCKCRVALLIGLDSRFYPSSGIR